MSAQQRRRTMWGGRFSEPLDPVLLDFTTSFGVDRRLLRWDAAASAAHARALEAAGVVLPADAEAIVRGLSGILRDVEAGTLAPTGAYEDVHSFLEALLHERIGPAAGRLHAGRSRNDQVATAFRLWVKEQTVALLDDVRALIAWTGERAAAALDVILPGFTHLQHAQPVRLGHHLLAYAWMLVRDAQRLQGAYDRADALPLGSGAVAGAGFPLDRRATAQRLGFARLTENSIDATGDRDFAVEAAFAAALLMVHLSRWADELVLWATAEFDFVALADRVSTGSSLMPQKKNPDPAELVRGRAARAAGSVGILLMLLKGLPAGYHRDLQEDKQAVFEALDTARSAVRAMQVFLDGVEFNAQAMAEASRRGWPTATEAADYLVRRGVPFREAHEAAGRVVRAAAEQGVPLWELPFDAYRAVSAAFERDVLDAVRLEAAVESKRLPGGTARAAVLDQLEALGAVARELAQWSDESRASLRRAAAQLG